LQAVIIVRTTAPALSQTSAKYILESAFLQCDLLLSVFIAIKYFKKIRGMRNQILPLSSSRGVSRSPEERGGRIQHECSEVRVPHWLLHLADGLAAAARS
jgi:hypothetical protein